MKKEFIKRVKRTNSQIRYSIYLLENGLFRVEKWGAGAFPLDVVTIDKNQAFKLKHCKDSILPYFVLNSIIHN